jgi:hypothetical protein
VDSTNGLQHREEVPEGVKIVTSEIEMRITPEVPPEAIIDNIPQQAKKFTIIRIRNGERAL